MGENVPCLKNQYNYGGKIGHAQQSREKRGNCCLLYRLRIDFEAMERAGKKSVFRWRGSDMENKKTPARNPSGTQLYCSDFTFSAGTKFHAQKP
jgi:hypothetical protein